MKANLNKLYLELVNAASLKKLRKISSAPFIVMLIASFALWYIAKLSYTYTTEIDVTIKLADQKVTTTCVVEGVGTNLVGYTIYSGGAIHISLSDIKFSEAKVEGDDGEYIELDKDMLFKAISVHYSDIKVLSVEPLPPIEVSERIEKIINEL